MIVQSTIDGNPHFVIEQIDHSRMTGRVAAAFGNEQFSAPTPNDLMVSVTAHHDEGWAAIDGLYEQSPETGLPHHLTGTPLPYLVKSSKASPDFNEKNHAYCGLLSSMHTYGLFNGRYGLSDFIFIDKISDDVKADVKAMLDAELERQDRLKEELAADAESAKWVEEDVLFDNYKLLQFFDTLSLYFHMSHAEGRVKTEFLNVPDGKGKDHTLSIEPTDDGAYTLSPFPFKGDSVEFSVPGRFLSAQPAGADFKEIFASTAKENQSYKLIAG
ncbi:MAG: DUF3891 family protein [Chloroflexi bacterium]|nr:DUF3891 family protein [Chloroflexota bacterium]